MNKKELQESILQAEYDRSEWTSVLRNWFGAKQISQIPREIKRDTKDWTEYVENAYELGMIFTDNGDREIGIYEVRLTEKPEIEINRVKLRSLLNDVYSNVDGALIVFIQGEKWRFSYVSEIRVRDENDVVVLLKTEPKRYTYLFGEGENCRTAADRFDKLKGKPLTLDDLSDAFSVEKLSKDFFKTYKEYFEKFWKYLEANKNYYKLLSDQEQEDEDKQTKPIRDFVKVLMGRLVFLQFLQKKGWMAVPVNRPDYQGGDTKYIQNLFANFSDKKHFHTTALRTLFFETLNCRRPKDLAPEILGKNIKIPYLNGGLFENDKSAEHDFDFPPEHFRDLLDFFERYNFTIDESDPFDREVGIDPEMLGHIFENLLEENREKGAFYTPKEIVHYMCQESLIEYLSNNLYDNNRTDIESLVRYNVVSESLQSDRQKAIVINDLLKRVKICDPAIGSGAFPMGLLKEIFECRRLLFAPMKEENFNAAEIKKEIIQNNIYGVDVEPGAVDIARLRFWLSLVVDEKEPQPLPNLDYKIMQGNSLLERFGEIDLRFDKSKLVADFEPERNLLGEYVNPQVSINDFLRVQQQFDEDFDISKLEEKFFKTDNPAEKNQIREKIERLERRFIKETLKRKEAEISEQTAERKTEIEEKAKNFPDERQRENFRQREYSRKSKNSPSLKELETQLENIERDKERLAKMKPGDKPYFLWHLYFLEVFDKKERDESGFDIFIGNPPYIQLQKLGAETAEYEKAGFQTFARTGDIYCLFYELGNKLLKQGGTLCYITSNKFMRANYGKALRELLWKNNISEIVDFGELPVFAAAATFPVVLNVQKKENEKTVRFTQIKNLDFDLLSDVVKVNSVQLNSGAFSGENWTLGDKTITELTEKLNSVGIPLKDYLDCEIRAGIKAGFNRAFIINAEQRRDLIEKDAKSAEIIFPYLAGDDVRKYHVKSENPKFIIFARRGIEIEKYKAVKQHLEEFRERLTPGIVGGRKPGTYKWFELQDTVAFYKLFESPKIIYPDIALEPRFHLDYKNYYIDMTAFIIPAEDKYLLALLNSRLIWFYLKGVCSVLGDAEKRGRLRLKRFYLENVPIKSIPDEQKEPFKKFVDYLTFLHDKTKPPVNPYADNKSIAAVFEDVLNMMVYELYFEEHLKENQIDVLRFLDMSNIFRDIGNGSETEQSEIIGAAYSWLQQSGNPIRDRITLANIRSKDIIRKINSSTH